MGWHVGIFEGKYGILELKPTLPETNSSPLKMDGWNTILSYCVSAYFQGPNLSFREASDFDAPKNPAFSSQELKGVTGW